MGGVINAVTKSGTNDLHGSVVRLLVALLPGRRSQGRHPRRTARSPRRPSPTTTPTSASRSAARSSRTSSSSGSASRRASQQDHVFRFTNTLLPPTPTASQAFGPEVDRRRISESRQTYHFGAKLDFVPAPDHRLTLSIFGSPSSGEGVRAGVGGDVAIADPSWMRETVIRNTTDVGAALGLQALRPQVADRGQRRRAPRVLQQLLADPGAQQPESAGVVGRQPLGPGADAGLRAANRQRPGLPALPGRQLPQRRVRPGQEVRRRALERRPQVDAHLRGGRPPRAEVRLALREDRSSTRTATTAARSASAALVRHYNPGDTRLPQRLDVLLAARQRAAVSVQQPPVRSADGAALPGSISRPTSATSSARCSCRTATRRGPT